MCLMKRELLVTIRTVAEGGEENGFRFDYFETIRKILEQQTADYVDVEAARDEEEVKALCQKYSNTKTKVIGSYHDFSKTPSVDEIKERLCKAKRVWVLRRKVSLYAKDKRRCGYAVKCNRCHERGISGFSIDYDVDG